MRRLLWKICLSRNSRRGNCRFGGGGHRGRGGPRHRRFPSLWPRGLACPRPIATMSIGPLPHRPITQRQTAGHSRLEGHCRSLNDQCVPSEPPHRRRHPRSPPPHDAPGNTACVTGINIGRTDELLWTGSPVEAAFPAQRWPYDAPFLFAVGNALAPVCRAAHCDLHSLSVSTGR